ncbi:2-amino-4-hydroxy-6-hydroxymethyldihydropteridinediphosphokinase [Moraxella cuniculi DSM 21768]|uniref:2-amino-4-hydroxy-6-hydroxymethyldihydropteridine pyrophosphokinase n=2 Tax=Moraxella cuniculi TaxID=34061 RepID=A0A1N7F9W6_9GAMM|nr:2-amino-4-hydroxy-6-hydroxymethyldihydropteridine diphosphokinase [Moraxella cuniculi]OOS03576.1 2-amino-4-hydroxy-6-hydroxymethyldihydropteridine diphosphokinase [Moraxella cuniculi]SIR97094.1 2-amino-4-hydroxy-6-hydroxymethyldihydropteridinediphosphokinase [Moraxella cuniculi DSM 21768]
MMKRCYLGLGANLGNELGTPIDHLCRAVQTVCQSPAFGEVRVSSLYRSVAYGVTDQPDFYNAVLTAKTSLDAFELLDFCQSMEQAAARVRLRHWGERSLDVDVLLYEDMQIDSERLTIPHRELALRNFVLVPLYELDAAITIAGVPIADNPLSRDMTGLVRLEADFANWANHD